MPSLLDSSAGARDDGAERFVEHLDSLLGDHVLPVRYAPGAADEPYLLAVDASGHPVVVEVAAVLDEETLLRGLRFAGRAATMSTEEIARAYPGGPRRYAAHLAAFRLTVPAARLLSTYVREGSRLVLACTEVAPEVRESVDFLLQHTQIEVLRLHTRALPGGAAEVVAEALARPTPRRTLPRPDVTRWVAAPPPAPSPAPPPAPLGGNPDPRLVRIAAELREPEVLVWRQPDGRCREALLHLDGRIELADGTVHGHPDAAARHLTRGGRPVDGWSVWRLGRETGPSLGAELTRTWNGPGGPVRRRRQAADHP